MLFDDFVYLLIYQCFLKILHIPPYHFITLLNIFPQFIKFLRRNQIIILTNFLPNLQYTFINFLYSTLLLLYLLTDIHIHQYLQTIDILFNFKMIIANQLGNCKQLIMNIRRIKVFQLLLPRLITCFTVYLINETTLDRKDLSPQLIHLFLELTLMQFHEISFLLLPLQRTPKFLRLLAQAAHQRQQLALDKLKRIIFLSIPHFFLLIIRYLMPKIIKLRQHHLHLQRERRLVHLPPQLLPKGLNHLLSDKSRLLILPYRLLIQSLRFIIDLFHISIQRLQFHGDLMRLIFNRVLFGYYLSMQLLIYLYRVHENLTHISQLLILLLSNFIVRNRLFGIFCCLGSDDRLGLLNMRRKLEIHQG